MLIVPEKTTEAWIVDSRHRMDKIHGYDKYLQQEDLVSELIWENQLR